MIKDLLIKMLVKILGELVTPELMKELKVEFICWLKAQVANSDNRIDDQVVEILAEALGVDCPK